VRFTLFLLIAVLLGAQQLHAQPTTIPFNADSIKRSSEAVKEANRLRMVDATIRYFVIKADSNTYGYSIYIDGKSYIHQTTIPATPGNRGFTHIDKAEKTALLVIEKIKQGEMPPTLTVDELRQRKIIQ
jgi:hypothetical protein